ncbi:MAG: tyrosine-type recombinase/integrase [Planctomycetia bacterium]|nr:tyrosine-type recombinase/integrase [Planctomycetia bacterium]
MARKRKRRQSHGSAWHWQQTDCWYCTLPGTKKRVGLFDEQSQRIRGLDNKEAAEVALARLKLSGDGWPAGAAPDNGHWIVARVCSEYLQYCERGLAKGTISKGHRDNAVAFLNDLCKYCGALPVAELKKAQVKTWLESHPTWRSSATHGSVIAIVQAAFNQGAETHGIRNPLVGLKRPAAKPRLQSLSQEDEETLYTACDEPLRNFLFALIHTGLRPFSELARLTAEDVEENGRGMMWRVYATKTKKTRKIPVRPEVAELTRKLMKSAPRGSGVPLFRNSRGKPWKRMTGVVRFLTLKKKLGWDQDPVRKKFSCYSCRHTFAHRMLSGYWNGGAGCSIETLAELIGDTPKVAFDHYGKEWGQHYQQPLWAAVGVPRDSDGPAPGKPRGPAEKNGRQHQADRGKQGSRKARARRTGSR